MAILGWRGIYPAATTQFKADLSLDIEVTKRMPEQLISGRGSELTRPPRLALKGEERKEVTDIIETALATRPGL